MKQASIWLLPIVALLSVGSLTYATSYPTQKGDLKKHDSHIVDKTVPFTHDSDIDAYLTSIRSFMLVPPVDGKFGGSRVPTVHGVYITTVPGYKNIAGLAKEYSIVSYVVGSVPDSSTKMIKEYIAKHPEAHLTVPKYRTMRVHGMIRPNVDQQTIYPELMSTVEATKAILDKQGYETYSAATKVGGVSGYIMAKAIRAPDKSCYKCHSTIKEGQPIGYVMGAIWKKAP